MGGRFELPIPFLVPVVVGLLAAVLIFVVAGGASFENARMTLAVAGVAVVAAAGLLILRLR